MNNRPVDIDFEEWAKERRNDLILLIHPENFGPMYRSNKTQLAYEAWSTRGEWSANNVVIINYAQALNGANCTIEDLRAQQVDFINEIAELGSRLC